jgi:hypothetical protein
MHCRSYGAATMLRVGTCRKRAVLPESAVDPLPCQCPLKPVNTCTLLAQHDSHRPVKAFTRHPWVIRRRHGGKSGG